MPARKSKTTKTAKKSSSMMGPACYDCDNCGNCCTSWSGIIHVSGGVGLGLLMVHYLMVPNLDVFGWALVAMAVMGHVVLWTKK